MRTKRFILTTSVVLLLALMLTAPVFAEGEAPPEEPAAEVPAEEAPAEPEVVESAPAEEAAPVAKEPPSEAPAEEAGEEATDEPAVDEPPVEETEAEESGEEALFEEPEESNPPEEGAVEAADVAAELADSGLELAAPDGESLDMASEEMAEAFKAPDPYFKVGTITYRFFASPGVCAASYPGDPNCHDNEGSDVIQDAIDYIDNNGTIPSDRKIYVEGATYTSNVDFNGASFSGNLASLNGLIGVDGSGSTFINGDVSFGDLTGGFTLQGFTINGGISAHDMAGTIILNDVVVTNGSGTGISMISNIDSAVVMDGVKSNSNSGMGADIDNTDSGASYNVTVKNSYFDENDNGVDNTYGLRIASLGKVTLENVSVSHNRGVGAYIVSDFSGLKIKNANFSFNDANPNSSAFGYGLYASTNKTATVSIDNMLSVAEQEIGGRAVALYTAGSITIKNATIGNNLGGGLYIDNTSGTGYIKIYTSTFNDNAGDDGLEIYSRGSVTLTTVSANNNGGYGARIDNCNDGGGFCQGNGSVKVTSDKKLGIHGANQFSDNDQDGLYIFGAKSIALFNINADENLGNGINAYNTTGSGNISLKKTIKSTDYYTYNNTAINNNQEGAELVANGSITVEYLVANENTYDGLFADNDGGSKAYSIVLKYSEFSENDRRGVTANSKGAIALTNVIANKNGSAGSWSGLFLYTLNGTSGGVTINSSKGFTNQFNENTQYSFAIYARGNVSLTRVESIQNNLGAYIDNWDSSSPRNVKISYGWFNETVNNYGLNIESKGSVKLDYVTVSDNDDGGALIGDTYRPTTISVRYSSFDRNDTGGGISHHGLEVYSSKSITLYAVSASMNGGDGIKLDNCLSTGFECAGNGSLSVKSKKGVYNVFNENGDDGLDATISGSTTLSSIMANDNTVNGIEFSGNWWQSSGNVSFNGSSTMPNIIHNNGSTGADIRSNGGITVKYADIFDNGGYGAYLHNNGALSPKPVSVSESSLVHNEETGLYMNSYGKITLQGVDASDNSIFEGSFVNENPAAKRDVLSHDFGPDRWTMNITTGGTYTMTLDSLYFDVYLEAYGPTGALLYSADNGGSGTTATITGAFGTGTHTFVVKTKDDAWGGGMYDLNWRSAGGSSHQPYRGIYIENYNESGGLIVKKSSKRKYGVRLWNNNYPGMRYGGYGTVSITSADVFYNGAEGLVVDNKHDLERNVTVSSSTITGSHSLALNISSRGNISVSKVDVYENLFGAWLGNHTATAVRTVKVTSSTFSGNLDNSADGLEITSKGSVTLSGVVAENPDGRYGVRIDNTYGEGNVTVTGKGNTFSNNRQIGIYINSKGNISLTNINAQDNLADGVYVNNTASGAAMYVKFTGSKFNNLTGNTGRGLYIASYGVVTINKVNASDNGDYTFINGSANPGVSPISITNSIFNDNLSSYGLYVNAIGKISLATVTASGNGAMGIFLVNQNAPGEDVILKKVILANNSGNGMEIRSAGKVTITTLDAFGDTSAYGLDIDNTFGSEAITITKANFYSNALSGLNIETHGSVSLNTVTAKYNQSYGILIDGDGNYGAVTLYKVIAEFNTNTGAYLWNAGDVSVTSSTLSANGTLAINADGLFVNSNGLNTVTINKSTIMHNYGNGVDLSSVGSYTISNSLVFANDIDGDQLPDSSDNVYVH